MHNTIYYYKAPRVKRFPPRLLIPTGSLLPLDQGEAVEQDFVFASEPWARSP